MQRIAVYCGSSPGGKPVYVQAAQALGQALAERDIELIYGGGKVGLMGAVARASLAAGGRVIGIIPESLLAKELGDNDITKLRVVESMAERKALMIELADGIIALPGGVGTLEELFETLSGAQLETHHKPVAILNVAGYYDDLLRFFDHTVTEQFIQPEHRAMLLVNDEPAALLDQMAAYTAPVVDKVAWIKRLSGDNGQAGD